MGIWIARPLGQATMNALPGKCIVIKPRFKERLSASGTAPRHSVETSMEKRDQPNPGNQDDWHI
jgi:hypothetical protein